MLKIDRNKTSASIELIRNTSPIVAEVFLNRQLIQPPQQGLLLQIHADRGLDTCPRVCFLSPVPCHLQHTIEGVVSCLASHFIMLYLSLFQKLDK